MKPGAVAYARVSTMSQVEKDVDGDGFSIPTQIEATRRKAEALGAEMYKEFIERGESARSADRPVLQEMLDYIEANEEIRYLIVFKLDRFARSVEDHVQIRMRLQQAGVRLISCSENIDESPSGRLLEGVMSAVAAFYSQNLAQDASRGMEKKARMGGTPNKCSLGYRNVILDIDGRRIRTVEKDPVRAPIIQWAFEAYADEEWSLYDLLTEVNARGLRTRGTRRSPEHALYLSTLHAMLRNPYYTGVVSWKGVQYPGRHEPLVSEELFERVQQRLDANRNGVRQRVYSNEAKGVLFCGVCGSRLSFSYFKGGAYAYWYCLSRTSRRGNCISPYYDPERIFEAVLSVWRNLPFDESWAEALRMDLAEFLKSRRKSRTRTRAAQVRLIARLEAKQNKLVDSYLEDSEAVPISVLKRKQQELKDELRAARNALSKIDADYVDIEPYVEESLAKVLKGEAAYKQASPESRKLMNQIFEKIRIYPDDPAEAQLRQPFELMAQHATLRHKLESASRRRATGKANTPALFLRHSSIKRVLVDATGFEPVTPSVSS
ncbi:MAG: recombinase family protein [Actinomycetota bacterium]